MKTFLFFFALFLSSFRQDKVIVCKSPTAYAYHNHFCRGLKECTHTVEYLTVKEALALKRKPCEYCYDTQRRPDTSPAGKGQCAALTKKGTQCSRKAGANGYCWQHSR